MWGLLLYLYFYSGRSPALKYTSFAVFWVKVTFILGHAIHVSQSVPSRTVIKCKLNSVCPHYTLFAFHTPPRHEQKCFKGSVVFLLKLWHTLLCIKPSLSKFNIFSSVIYLLWVIFWFVLIVPASIAYDFRFLSYSLIVYRSINTLAQHWRSIRESNVVIVSSACFAEGMYFTGIMPCWWKSQTWLCQTSRCFVHALQCCCAIATAAVLLLKSICLGRLCIGQNFCWNIAANRTFVLTKLL